VRRLYDEVGWRPQLGLHDAIADTISWWRQRMASGALTAPRS
jgi:nucleoside-diphosphate-sugar epimerase